MKTMYQSRSNVISVNKNRLARKIFLWNFVFLLVSFSSLAATVNGFVTKIDSPTVFDVGALHVVFDTNTQCDVKTAHTLKARAYPFGNIPAPYGQWKSSKSITTATQSCDALHLVVGLRIRLTGALQKKGQFMATQAVVYRIVPSKNIDGAALIENTPEILQGNHGWSGTLWMNGYPMTVIPKTKMLSAPSSTTFRYGLHLHWNGNLRIHANVASAPNPKPFSVDQIKTNTWGTYHATRASDGAITTSQFRLWPNHVGAKEKAYLEETATVIHTPDYSRHIPGKVQLKDGEAAEIFPDQKVQDFVQNLGMEVVPQYQKHLRSADATKINFRFYVVPSWTVNPGNGLLNINIDGGLSKCNIIFSCTSNILRFIAPIKYIIAMPDGVILVPDSTLAVLQNKSQLAAILSYAVTSSVQKQAYIAWPLIMRLTATWNFRADPVGAGEPLPQSLGVWLNEQLLRIGIRQMYLAGYDIREAPFAWAVARSKPVNNPVINSKHPDKEIPWYAAYAFNYISHYYKDVDYSKLKRGEKEYQQFLQELYKADPSLPHPKVAAAATSAAATK